MIQKYLILVFALVFSFQANAQIVASSKKMNIRSDYGYEILGNLNENILLYRDKGFEQRLVIFDNNLEFIRDRELDFEEKRARVIGLSLRDTSFLAFYSFKEDGNEIIKMAAFDEYAERLDTMTIFKKEKTFFGGREYIHLLSEDKSKSFIYTIEKKDMLIAIIYDNETRETILKEEYLIEGRNLRRDLDDIIITNQGDLVLLMETDRSRFKNTLQEAEIVFLHGRTGTIVSSKLALKDMHAQDILVSFDNRNRKIGITGLYSDENNSESKGYFYGELRLGLWEQKIKLNFSKFEQSFINEIYGTKSSKKEGIKNFQLVDIQWRRDGGLVVFGEMQKEFSRRPNYDGGYGGRNYYGIRSWVDYFNEDMFMISLHPDGEEHWKRVLYKKQFSQDDGAIFSSFFLFKTPSRIRLIYNDEIKNNNIVSEYVLGPLGKNKRESIFSTEYQNLKLRLKDAVQISPFELLVPSEKNSNLSIVKITYN